MARLAGMVPLALLIAVTACNKEDKDEETKAETGAASATAAPESDAPGVGTVKAGDRTVEAGGVKVKTGADGQEVQAGGVKVKSGPDGSEVQAGGVKVSKDGKVTVPGVNVP